MITAGRSATMRRALPSGSSKLPLPLAVLAMVLAASMPVSSPPEAHATHGSWTDHHLWLLYPGTSSQHSYADVGASSLTDYSHARWLEVHSGTVRSVTCWDDCGYVKTPTMYMQGQLNLESRHCARASSHTLWGTSTAYQPCAHSAYCGACPTHDHTGPTHQWPP